MYIVCMVANKKQLVRDERTTSALIQAYEDMSDHDAVRGTLFLTCKTELSLHGLKAERLAQWSGTRFFCIA